MSGRLYTLFPWLLDNIKLRESGKTYLPSYRFLTISPGSGVIDSSWQRMLGNIVNLPATARAGVVVGIDGLNRRSTKSRIQS
ncbi:hypothetical protein E6H33_05005 [Candidatus Bathyarchaeota archaeon]|nr:MAG: hypothetical protein E6H33_05005 [Candidatus Bathyarchaeota archaeon]